MDKGYTQEQLAQKMGISQSSVANKLRLLNLDESVQQALLEGKISERHARSLLVLNDAEKEKEWLNRIITERLTVRQLDQELKKLKESENKSDIPLVDLSFNAEDIKNNSFDINKNSNKISKTDDILKDYSENPDDTENNGGKILEKPNVEIIDTLSEPISNNSDILTNPYEIPNKTTFFETLEPLAPEEQAKQNVGNKGYFSFNFDQPEEPTPVKKDLEVLKPETSQSDNSSQELLNESPINSNYPNSNLSGDSFNNNFISGLNPNNKFFTPLNNNQNANNQNLSSNLNKPDEEELFDPMSLLGDLTNDTPSNNTEDLAVAKKDIEDVINNLKLQGFKVNYSFENKDNGCKIIIDID